MVIRCDEAVFYEQIRLTRGRSIYQLPRSSVFDPFYLIHAEFKEPNLARDLRETCSMPTYCLYIMPNYNHVKCHHPKFAISLPPQRSLGLGCKVKELPSGRRTYHHCETVRSRSEPVLEGRGRVRVREHGTLLAGPPLLLGEGSVGWNLYQVPSADV